VPDQLHCEPLAPFVCSSAMLQVSAGAAGLPLTVACNVTWPLAGIVTADGETVTVTLLGSKLLPPPQPAMTISRTSDSTKRARNRFITDHQQEDHLNFWVHKQSAFYTPVASLCVNLARAGVQGRIVDVIGVYVHLPFGQGLMRWSAAE